MNGRSRVLWVIIVAATLIIPANAFAHAVVYPKQSEARAYEKYVLRVPNERDVATTSVEIYFPRSVRVVSFAEVPGWRLQIVTDSAKHVTGAIWTGSLAPERFVEFPFVAVNPDSTIKLVWPAFQTYSSGERVDWVGAEDAKAPASVTLVVRPAGTSSGALLALWVCLGALVLSLVALFFALRPESGTTGFQPGA
jgi:uncharacterized protein YcnI